jgi:peptidoglycan hydrolase FlgJ
MFRADSTANGLSAGFADLALPLPGPAAGKGDFAAAIGAAQADIVNCVVQGFGPGTVITQSAWSTAQLAQRLAAFGDTQLLAATRRVPDAAQGSLDMTRQAFLDEIAPWTEPAAKALGVAPRVIAAHAALESDWGQRPLKTPQGATTYNLFGIKTGQGWKGDAVDALTSEFLNGADLKVVERFRSYEDYGDAFRDYTRLLRDNPRYASALNAGDDAGAFGRALSRAGYATDAAYGEKLASVANQIQSMIAGRSRPTAVDERGVIARGHAVR